jgi:hypothetical protein
MQSQEAIDFLEPVGIQFVYNDTLKRYLLILDESYVYITPEDMERFDMTSFKSFVARVLFQYRAAEPHIVYH